MVSPGSTPDPAKASDLVAVIAWEAMRLGAGATEDERAPDMAALSEAAKS
jgi:hypothetical protein